MLGLLYGTFGGKLGYSLVFSELHTGTKEVQKLFFVVKVG